MVSIRPLTREDLSAVVSILKRQFPGWTRGRAYLEASLFEHPFADGEAHSFVAISDGEVAGFVGAQSRRLSFDGRELVGVCVGQMAVLPERARGAGGLLIARVLSGPQNLTWADSATDDVVRMWRALKGGVDHARAVDFLLVQRPLRWATGVVGDRVGRRGGSRRQALPVGAVPLQALGRRAVPSAFAPPPAEVEGIEASATEIAAVMPELRQRLRVDYSEDALAFQLGLVERVAGPVTLRIVRADDRALGWYAYLRRRRTPARLIQLAAVDEKAAEPVLSELLDHLRRAGVGAISGRAEPHLHRPLRDRFAALGYGLQPVVHSRDPELLAVLAGGRSLLTELDSVDSEWWTGPDRAAIPAAASGA